MRWHADAVPGALVDGEFVPDWLAAADAPWLRELLLEAAAFDGRPFAALRDRWRQHEVPPRAGARWPWVLAELRAALLPRRGAAASAVRAAVFAAVAGGASRAAALAAGAAVGRCAVAAVEAALFADLGDQRCVAWPAGWDVDAVRRAVNARWARVLLATANAAELELGGSSRAVLKTAWLHGAHFRVRAVDADVARLEWLPAPGDARPGRRLAAVLGVLPWARRFLLRASVRWRGMRCALVLSNLDALAVGAAPAEFDSGVERAFAAALVRECGGWELRREPVPLPIGERLAFPDFALVRGAEVWWVELAGLRQRSALAGKLDVLARVERYVLVLPQEKCPVDCLGHARVVGYRRGKLDSAAARVAGIVAMQHGAARLHARDAERELDSLAPAP
ncbi:MAG: DUF790 family protein [Planctomycetes bacterium]|nr:DUF790 family protein [Planctomycetota bacterium]